MTLLEVSPSVGCDYSHFKGLLRESAFKFIHMAVDWASGPYWLFIETSTPWAM